MSHTVPLQVTDALASAGLESSNLIVGIDFTKSNEWTGKISQSRNLGTKHLFEPTLDLLN